MRQLNERCFAELHLAGNFSPPSLKQELIDRLHFADIFLHGHVAREQVKRLLSEARAGQRTQAQVCADRCAPQARRKRRT